MRKRWNNDQKKMMLKNFSKFIKMKKAPNKAVCEEFRAKNEKLFEDRSWVDIKTFVFNTYRVMKSD